MKFLYIIIGIILISSVVALDTTKENEIKGLNLGDGVTTTTPINYSFFNASYLIKTGDSMQGILYMRNNYLGYGSSLTDPFIVHTPVHPLGNVFERNLQSSIGLTILGVNQYDAWYTSDTSKELMRINDGTGGNVSIANSLTVGDRVNANIINSSDDIYTDSTIWRKGKYTKYRMSTDLVESYFEDFTMNAQWRVYGVAFAQNNFANNTATLVAGSTTTTLGTDCGLAMMGYTTTSNFAFNNMSKVLYYQERTRITNTTAMHVIGGIRTTTNLFLSTARTGVFFFTNITAGGSVYTNWSLMSCEVDKCVMITTPVIPEQNNFHVFEIIGNNRFSDADSTSFEMRIDGVSYGSVPSNISYISSVGHWMENTDTVADTLVYDYTYYEFLRRTDDGFGG